MSTQIQVTIRTTPNGKWGVYIYREGGLCKQVGVYETSALATREQSSLRKHLAAITAFERYEQRSFAQQDDEDGE